MGSDSREFYQENFTPESYKEMLLGISLDKMHVEWEFMFKKAAEIFKDPKYGGRRSLLDLSTGPSPFSVFPAVHHFSEITLSEFTDKCREELKRWVDEDPKALDWKPLHNIGAKFLEYQDIEAGRNEIESLMRQKVKAVLPCDFLSDEIIPKEHQEQHDCVMSTLALDALNLSLEEYKAIIKKFAKLVKLNGYFVLKGLSNAGFWKCGESQFPNLSISQENIQKSFEEAGFGQIVWNLIPKQDDFHVSFDNAYCMVCTKEKDI